MSIAGCSGPPAFPPAIVTTELTTEWELLDHRLSILEMSFQPDPNGEGGVLHAQNEGGAFGAIDHVGVRAAFTVYRGDAVRAIEASAFLEIGPTGTTDPEQMVAMGEAIAELGELKGVDVVEAFIRGYRISTNDYGVPPDFASDPMLPYDPADGFTTQGVGIQLGAPRVSGTTVTVPVSARVSNGPSDRADMNAAIPRATTWVRVDIVVIGAVGVAARAQRGEVSYALSTATYGMNTLHPHADDATQELVIAGAPGFATGITGLTGFDIWVNVPGRIDPSCVVVQDAINSWGEPVAGPGRYLTALSTRVHDVAYDDVSGAAHASADIYFSSTSMLKEIGNVCMGARAELGLLQLATPTSQERYQASVENLPFGERWPEPIRWAELGGSSR